MFVAMLDPKTFEVINSLAAGRHISRIFMELF